MTAEIGFANKTCVVLAADSAGTVQGSNHAKIYNNANKLFNIAYGVPVGIMIYNHSELVGIPWEVIIKEYRCHLGTQKFNTLKKYFHHFSEWVKSFISRNYPIDSIKEKEKEGIKIYINKIIQIILSTSKEQKLSFDHILKSIKEDYTNNSSVEEVMGGSEFTHEYVCIVEEILKSHKADNKNYVPTEEHIKYIISIAFNLYYKDTEKEYTGVVVAGYGEEEIFPSIIDSKFFAVGDRIFIEKIKNQSINFEQSALIMPFAQRDMMDTFIMGVNRDLQEFYGGIFEKYFDLLVKTNPAIPEEEKNKVREDLIVEFNNNIHEEIINKHFAPIIDTLSHMDKEDIAELAESLINITSLKRKSTFSLETVGGPIDVAVISKGDGFIWMKRKHYFDRALNYSFFESRKPSTFNP